jgi:hypothetical protein
MGQQQAQNTGSFIATSNIWDVSQIYSTEVTKPEFKELLVRLFQNLNNMALSVNGKDAGIYHTDEFVNGQTFFPNPALNSTTASKPEQRQVYRKVINFGALPNTAAKPVAHGLSVNKAVSFTRIYATATDPVGLTYLPIPYASPVLANNIELSVDTTNVTITTGSNRSAFTTCYVVLEYLKS